MENTISTGKAAKLLGITVKTLQRWEREGRLTPVGRTDSNRRLYTVSQIKTFIGMRHIGQCEGDQMQLTHKIKLNPTEEQRKYFHKAAVTSRFVWNWALAQWKAQYDSEAKAECNSTKKNST